jgi:hypothetical protein
MKNLLFIYCFWGFLLPFFGQNITSKIVNKISGEAIPFVNIGVINSTIGTVSDEKGTFTLDLKNAKNTDTLKISIISYKTITLNIGVLRTTNFPSIIKMSENVVELDEVIISNRERKPFVLGLDKKHCYPIPFYKKVTSKVSFPQKNYRHEIGTRFTNAQLLHLDSIQLNFANCNLTEIELRINVSVIKNDVIKNILTKPIYVTLSKKEALNFPIINLTKFAVQLDTDFLISIENYTKMENNSLSILANFKSKGKKYPTYYRQSSQSKWTQLKAKKSKDFGLSFLVFGH